MVQVLLFFLKPLFFGTVSCSLRWALNFAAVDVIDDIVGMAAIDGASHRLSGSQDLLDGSGELPGDGARPHDAGDAHDLIEGHAAAVLNVLDLLPVARRLLQGFDDQSRRRGNHLDRCLPVLDGQLHSDPQALPVTGGLGDVVTHFLGRQTQRSDFGGQG